MLRIRHWHLPPHLSCAETHCPSWTQDAFLHYLLTVCYVCKHAAFPSYATWVWLWKLVLYKLRGNDRRALACARTRQHTDLLSHCSASVKWDAFKSGIYSLWLIFALIMFVLCKTKIVCSKIKSLFKASLRFFYRVYKKEKVEITQYKPCHKNMNIKNIKTLIIMKISHLKLLICPCGYIFIWYWIHCKLQSNLFSRMIFTFNNWMVWHNFV